MSLVEATMPLPETASPCAFLRCSTVQPELQPALCAQVARWLYHPAPVTAAEATA